MAKEKTQSSWIDEVLDSITDAFYIVDDQWRFTYINRKAEKWWQRSKNDLLGTLMWDMFPAPETTVCWEMHHKAATERIAVQWDAYSPFLNAWVEVNVYPLSSGGLAIYYRDITERKKTEEVILQNEERQAYLLKLSDAIKSLTDPNEIQMTAACVCGEHIGVDRAFYSEVVMKDGIAQYDVRHIYQVPEFVIAPGFYPLSKCCDENDLGNKEQTKIVCGIVNESGIDQESEPDFGSLNVKSWVTVPVIKDGAYVACFGVHHRRPRQWTLQEVLLMKETAANILDAVEQARAEKALRESRAQLATELEGTRLLHRISAELINDHNPEALYEKIIATASKIMHSQFASIQMFRPGCDNDEKLKLLAYLGFNENLPGFWLWMGISAKSIFDAALRSGQRVIVKNINKCDFMRGTAQKEIFLQTTIQAFQITPLFSRTGRLVGLISTYWNEPYKPSENELCLMDVLARQAADMLERKLDEEKISRQNVILQAINAVHEKCIFSDTMQHLGNDCLKIIEKVTHSEISFVAEFGKDTLIHNILVSVAGRECLNICEEERGMGRPFSSFFDIVVNGGKTFLTNDTSAYAEIKDIPPGHPLIQSFLGVPFLRDGKVAGMIGVANRNGGYTEDERQILEAMTPMVFEVLLRKRAEEALQKSESKAMTLVDELTKTDQSKNEFIGVLSHELRNPLAAISAGLQLLDVAQDEKQREKAKKIMKRQMKQISKLVDDLLDLTRITQNKVHLRKEYININEIVRNTIEDLRPEFTKKGVQLGMKIRRQPVIVYADPVRITQILGNILFNALKFTPTDGMVWLSLSQDKNSAVIKVTDTGIGVNPEIIPQLFTPFTQVNNTLDRQMGGLGLGLSIVKGIIELHNGSVTAFSKGLGKGSVFSIRLPVAAVKEEERHTIVIKDHGMGSSTDFTSVTRKAVVWKN